MEMFESGELAEALGVEPSEEPVELEEPVPARQHIGLENKLD